MLIFPPSRILRNPRPSTFLTVTLQFFQCFDMKRFFQFLKQFFHLKRGEKINIEYPISWDTMSKDDFRNVCKILSKPYGRMETLFLCLCALANIRPDSPIKYDPKAIKDNVVFIIQGKSYVISPKVIREACSQLEFILDDIGLPPSPIPKIDRKLYGLSFEQYYKADAFMLKYISDSNNEKWLKEAVKAMTDGRIRN